MTDVERVFKNLNRRFRGRSAGLPQVLMSSPICSLLSLGAKYEIHQVMCTNTFRHDPH